VNACAFGAFTQHHQQSGDTTMETAAGKKHFNKRAFTSIALLLSGLVLPVSGIMNHQLQCEPLTQSRHFWMSVHNMSAALFTLFAITHASLNWRSLAHYAKNAQAKVLTKEAVLAAVLITTVVGLFASHVYHVR
jgi:hypothetical protein